MQCSNNPFKNHTIREGLNTLLFDLHHPWGRRANMIGMLVIIGSVLMSMVGTLQDTGVATRSIIRQIEITITVLFAIEYFARVLVAHKPIRYILGFYGIVDLLTWLPLLLFGDIFLAIRLIRILRLLKLLRYLRAIRLFFASMIDIFDIVFVVLATICLLVLVSGNLIFLIEPETYPNAFIGCWWALVTMTTVGYGDMVPVSTGGRILASIVMLLGITMFALLTGTLSIKLSEHVSKKKKCIHCNIEIAEAASYCEHCGERQQETG